MRERAGVVTSISASLLFLATLLGPYVVKNPADITLYYATGLLNPLLAGIFVAAILGAFFAIRSGAISRELGWGAMLGFGIFTLLVTAAWAATVRLDVFQATTWAMPLQRYVLVALAILLVLGAGSQVWTGREPRGT